MGVNFEYSRTLEYHDNDINIDGIRFVIDRQIIDAGGIYADIIVRGVPLQIRELSEVQIPEVPIVDYIPPIGKFLITPIKVILRTNKTCNLRLITVYPLRYKNESQPATHEGYFPIHGRTFTEVPF